MLSYLVTLGACQIGLGHGRGGGALGLTHAFSAAGTSTLVVSRWRVEDGSTARLMQDFYLGVVQGEAVAEALRQARIEALTCHPHAGYWAAFAVWGRVRSGLPRRWRTRGP
jgi:CHAT domain-containing protein